MTQASAFWRGTLPPAPSDRGDWLAAQRSGADGAFLPKALRLVQHAEKELGFALTCKTIGGRGGGGSTLTAEARQFLERYEAYRDACVQTSRELYSAFFPGQR